MALVCVAPVTNGHLCVFLGEPPARTPYPRLSWVVRYFPVELRESLITLWTRVPLRVPLNAPRPLPSPPRPVQERD